MAQIAVKKIKYGSENVFYILPTYFFLIQKEYVTVNFNV